MNASNLKFTRLTVLGLILLSLLVFTAFQAGGGTPSLAASDSPKSPSAISLGQQAAINGASQLLLLQPQVVQRLYLPLIRH